MVIKNGLVFEKSGRFVKKDVFISGGLISNSVKNVNSAEAAGTAQTKISAACAAAQIEQILKPAQTANSASESQIVDAENLYVIPGLIDIHFHGCEGYDFCDASEESLLKIAQYELSQGITAICPASMSYDEKRLTEIFKTAAIFHAKQQNKNFSDSEDCATFADADEEKEHENRAVCAESKKHRLIKNSSQYETCAELVGINMEGPFISVEKRGAQNEKYIRNPDVEMFERLQIAAGGLIKLVDIAPETQNAVDFIKKLHNKVRISLAHTTSDYKTTKTAFEAGARHVTHLFNAMKPFHHREPGVIGAACDNENVTVELIADGVHADPVAVRIAFKMFGDNRIILVSDSMEACGLQGQVVQNSADNTSDSMQACGLQDGNYKLGGQNVNVCGNVATLDDGTIAGSVTNLMDCLRIAVQKMNIPLESAIKCATVNPAKAVGIFDKQGSLDEGKMANIVLLDKNLNIVHVIKNGQELVPNSL